MYKGRLVSLVMVLKENLFGFKLAASSFSGDDTDASTSIKSLRC